MKQTSPPDDFHIDDFVQILQTLDRMPPVTTDYEEQLQVSKPAGSSQGPWFHDQRERMISWFSEQGTRGTGQSRRKRPNHSARTAYNRLMVPEGVLWIAEALGEDPLIVKVAVLSAEEAPSRSRAAAIRKVLPWQRIHQLARQRQASSEEAH